MATPETALAMARSVFPPEFLNRLELIVFNALSQDTMARVCVGLAQEVSSQLEANSGVRLSVSPEAALFISNKAYVPEYGAPPIRRMIQSDLATEVANCDIGPGEEGGRGCCDGAGAGAELCNSKGFCVVRHRHEVKGFAGLL